jgi:NADPH:quinone reductase-like Zn-dependent oxidoreductase
VGERVFGVAPRGLATRAVTAEAALARMPEGLAMAEAASLPVAFLTAIHALEELARLGPGERVLIHGGAGAVGLAALQVALAAGARVAVTAGSEARRAFLRAAGAEIALDSRDLGFADALAAHWGPGGGEEACVDVCLNSLSGEAMERSLGLMAPFGRFLELGKRDYAEATRVALRPLRRNVSYFAVDVDELAQARPAVATRHLASLAGRVASGALRPLPVQVHDGAEDAFRRLQAGGHIGKLVIRPPAERPAAAPAWAGSGTAVVVGGAAGFGLEAACWLAGQGAGQGVRHLALLSRRGATTPGAEAARERLAALGAQARFLAVDAADPVALAAALDEIRRTMPPIEAVLHAAAVLHDGIAARLDDAAVAGVWRAKVSGGRAAGCADGRGPVAAVPAVLLGDRADRQPGPGRLCRRQCRAGGHRAPPPCRGPPGAGDPVGADRRCGRAGVRWCGRAVAPAGRHGAPRRRCAGGPAWHDRGRAASGRARPARLARGASRAAPAGRGALRRPGRRRGGRGG